MRENLFRYKLDIGNDQASKDAVAELVASQLRNLLDVAVPTWRGKELKVDGFRLLSDQATIREIGYPGVTSPSSSLGSVILYEPRIEFIKRQLESLLSVIELEADGAIVSVDGFRLKNLCHWLVSVSSDLSEILEYAASRCNCDCIMCYNKGNPPSLALKRNHRRATDELKEIKARLYYFSPAEGVSLFPSLGTTWEVTAHPRFVEIFRLLRDKTSRPVRIHTNGRNLTPEMVKELADSKPLYLYLSLNSSSPQHRQRLMRDNKPEVAISAPMLLRDMEIPYAVVIVPWPVDSIAEMCDDLRNTITYADGCGAHMIEVNLPGYSRWFSSVELFDLDEVWQACVSTVRDIRQEMGCPVVAMPTMYEENLYEERKNVPGIIGLVPNSPAVRSGLRKGDIITAINNIPVKTRPQARDMLSTLQKSEYKQAVLAVNREGNRVDIKMDLDDFSYPFTKAFDNHLGIIFIGTGLRLAYIEKLKEMIDEHKAEQVLFLSSALARPTFEQCLRESRLLDSADLKIDVEVPQNNYFGGNIFMGDLLVVQDFIDCIKQYLLSHSEPDLIVIPSSPFALGGWRRDLTGRVYLDIEREVRTPVRLLECDTIYD